MVKKSFTLFEIIVSLIILGVVLSLVLKIFSGDETVETYYELQTIENQYNESSVIKQSEKIQFQTQN